MHSGGLAASAEANLLAHSRNCELGFSTRDYIMYCMSITTFLSLFTVGTGEL